MLEYSLGKRKRPLILRLLRCSDLVLNASCEWQPVDDPIVSRARETTLAHRVSDGLLISRTSVSNGKSPSC